MAAKGLEGIWGLESLNRTGINLWKLVALVVGSLLSIGLILITVLPPVHPGSELASFYTPKVLSAALMSVFFQISFTIVAILYLARTTEADLYKLSEIDDAVGGAIERLQPRLRLFLPFVLLFLLFGLIALPVLGVLRTDISLIESLSNYLNSGITLNVLAFVLVPLEILLFGIAIGIVSTQVLALNHAARTIKINLPQLDRYSTIANPAIRLSILHLFGLSGIALMIPFVSDPEFTESLKLVLLLMVAVAWPIVAAFFAPAFILRNRIRSRRQQELEAIYRSLDGDDQAIRTINISPHGVPVTTSDLLTHQMFIESRWEWPIAGHVQKLILFGLLPPVTWVLAAIIENTLF